MYNFAVVVTFSFSDQVSVLLFRTYEEALDFLKNDILEEYEADIRDKCWDSEYTISEEDGRAVLTTHFADKDDVVEWKIGTVYDPKED